MTAPRDYAKYLRDILVEVQFAKQFVSNVEYDQFVENPEKLRAVIRSLEVIGEATRSIPQSFRDQYPDVLWRDMAGMRDRLIHGYAQVDLQRVWDTVKDDLPIMQEQIQQILDELDSTK